MPSKLGLSTLAALGLLSIAAPAFADTTVPGTTVPGSTVPASTVPDSDVPGTTIPDSDVPESAPSSSTTTSLAEPVLNGLPGVVAGPAIASRTPIRGTQLQITPPPPPPPSPFDPPANSGWGRRVVYSKSKQTVWAYDERNTIIKMHRVSGRQDPRDPSPGVYRVWSRSLRTFSINNPTITWNYMVRFAKGDRGGNIGFHDIPYQYGRPVQTITQLGQALSGGCVRQAAADAVWMWNWAQIGTVVVVTP